MEEIAVILPNASDESMLEIRRGIELVDMGKLAEAELCFRNSISLQPTLAIAHNNLGLLKEMTGAFDEALACYDRALRIDPGLLKAKTNFDKLLHRLMKHFFHSGDLRTAALYGERLAQLNRGSKWYAREDGGPLIPSEIASKPKLSLRKLKHDLEQLQYMQQKGILSSEIGSFIQHYKKVIGRHPELKSGGRRELDAADLELIGQLYGRIVHHSNNGRVERALSSSWDPVSAERLYQHHPLGIVVIDDFLTQEALLGIREFCLSSTVWFENRYGHGRLGAFFRDGFNCPLLIQIAEEIHAAFPNMIGKKYALEQLWGFKYDNFQPRTHPHADFAAINVNFWITPDTANLDQNSGGLIIYDVKAPADWDFDSYNKKGEKIDQYLDQQEANALIIPYKANRAVIFNSDLFHATSSFKFDKQYTSRRINITMLYGKRNFAE